jgi:hypothetical protein
MIRSRPLAHPPLRRLSMPRGASISRFGAAIGLPLFLSMILLSFLLHRGSAGEQLFGRVFGGGDAPALGASGAVALGLASAAVASLLATLGGVARASIRALTRTSTAPRG